MSFRSSALIVAAAALFLGGCAANVRHAETSAPVKIGSNATSQLVLHLDGSKVATESGDWEQFKGVWRQAMKEEAARIGARFASQEGAIAGIGEPGTLIYVNIDDFRLISAGARYGLGVMTGNAFVDAQVSYRDLASGETWGDRRYNTKSTAWQGIFSAMTEKQVRAMCREIVDTLSPGSAGTAHATQ